MYRHFIFQEMTGGEVNTDSEVAKCGDSVEYRGQENLSLMKFNSLWLPQGKFGGIKKNTITQKEVQWGRIKYCTGIEM